MLYKSKLCNIIHNPNIFIYKYPVMKNRYVLVGVDFAPNEFPETQRKIHEACMFLESMINSEMFKEFILNGEYTNTRGLDNQGVYDFFMAKNIVLKMQLTAKSNLNRGFTVNQTTNLITVRPKVMEYWSIAKIAAVIAHEYGHILGFDHYKNWASSFLYYIQFYGEILFDKYYPKLKRKGYPKPGSYLTYEPLWGWVWFYKVLKWT